MTSQLLESAEALSAEVLMDRVLSESCGRVCITCSFQAEDMAVLDMLRSRVSGLPVLFLDTGYHFQETYAYRDRMAATWKLNLRNLAPAMSVADQESAFGILNRTDPGRCCQLRKVDPLMAALEDFDLWFTGLRREQSPTRKNLKKIERHHLPSGRSIDKISVLADWSWPQVSEYVTRHQIELLPLYHLGYPSIGCEPCTSLPLDPGDPRSGRWAGKKLECGIHTFSKRED
ncbi:MAG TPA: phosphoadenylyl-sulfate reductase [Candidatus Angelobacter sp.]|nr:phosphoadenylyl-sulfate reductase [Candidatus Angelobacter sp.]